MGGIVVTAATAATAVVIAAGATTAARAVGLVRTLREVKHFLAVKSRTHVVSEDIGRVGATGDFTVVTEGGNGLFRTILTLLEQGHRSNQLGGVTNELCRLVVRRRTGLSGYRAVQALSGFT